MVEGSDCTKTRNLCRKGDGWKVLTLRQTQHPGEGGEVTADI